MDNSSSRPPDPASVFRLCSTVHMVALVRVRSSISFSPTSWPRWHFSGFPPSAVRCWLSREAIPRLDRDLRLRLAAMASDLHGVRVDVSSDNFQGESSLLFQPPSFHSASVGACSLGS